MTVNIIHDSRMYRRLVHLLAELAAQEIRNFVLWNPVEDTKSVVRSINLSHKQIVQDAKDRGLSECCIAEDDLMFTAKGGWEWFLQNKPKTFDLYLWGSYCLPLSNNKVTGFQLYIIHEKFYDAFLGTPEDVHIDTEMDYLNGDYKYCYPFSALQRPCWSANNRAEVNYNSLLKEEDLWQGFPLLHTEK